MEKIARVDRNNQIQPLETHLRNVSENCRFFLSACGFGETGRLLGLLHDQGKYSEKFQRYIKSQCGLLKDGEPGYMPDAEKMRGHIPHAEVGAWYLESKIPCNRDQKALLESPIMYHHGFPEDIYAPNGSAFFEKTPSKDLDQPEIYSQIDSKLKTEIDSILIKRPYIEEIKRFCQIDNTEEFEQGVLLRLLYSCLIDSDRLDAAGEIPQKFTDWAMLARRMEQNLAGMNSDGKLNSIRRRISDETLKAAERSVGIYRFTIPTGGGKTYAGLRFAQKHAERHKMKRIIYAAPFLSILEQNADDIRRILGDPSGEYVLECHSNVLHERTADNDETPYDAISEAWNAPIICTSMVQLLNAMFSGESRYARRFHQLSESIILLDEIQSLPVEMYHIFSRMINFFAERTGSTVILCSATQPKLDSIDDKKGAVRLSCPQDLYPDYPDLFVDLKRVETRYIQGIRTNEDIAEFIDNHLHEERSILLICNTKPHAADMFRMVRERHPECRVFHLSTNLCPAHRKDILQKKIRPALASGEQVIVVSTSLIEAGVNISFSCVIRMMTSLDSIVQAAGRCNRNAEANSGRVYILDNPISLRLTQSVACWIRATKKALRDFECDPERYDNDILSPKQLEDYYHELYSREDTKKAMTYPVKVEGWKDATLLAMLGENQPSFNAYRRLHNLSDVKPHICGAFRTAGEKFKALEDITSSSVIVPYGDKGNELIARLQAEPEPDEFRRLLREAQLYSVNITECTERELLNNKEVYWLNERYKILAARESCYDCGDLGLGESQGSLSTQIF